MAMNRPRGSHGRSIDADTSMAPFCHGASAWAGPEGSGPHRRRDQTRSHVARGLGSKGMALVGVVGQKSAWPGTRNRSITTSTRAVTAMSTVASAMAWPKFTGPGRPRKR